MKSHAPRRHRFARPSRRRSLHQTTRLQFEPLEQRVLLTIDLMGVPTWFEQGPRPIVEGSSDISPNDPVTGAVESIAVNPNNPAQIYVASVNGGIWRTDNADPNNPAAMTWTPLTLDQTSLATSSIEFSPLDATGNTLFAATGTFSNLNNAGSPPIGILRTTDGGATWLNFPVSPGNEPRIKTILPTSIDLDPGADVAQMVLVAGIDGASGLYRSDDNGETFSLLSGANGLPFGAVSQLIADPNDTQRFYAAVPGAGGGVFRGDFNAGTGVITWTAVNNGIVPADIGTSANIQLAAHDAGATTVLYVGLADPPAAGTIVATLTDVYRSPDNGANWNPLGTPAGFNAWRLAGSGYNMIADPVEDDVVYIGGLGGDDNVFRYNPAGPSWDLIVGAGAMNNTAPHADSRDMAFIGNNVLIESDDGGVYFIENPLDSANNEWQSFIGETATGNALGGVEFHDIAYDSNSNIIFGAAQDNGTVMQLTPNNRVWTQEDLLGGDGGDVVVDLFTLAGANQSIRYFSSQRLGDFRRQVFDNTNATVGAPVELIPAAGLAGFLGQFITPVEINAIAPPAGESTRIVIGGGTDMMITTGAVYEANNAGVAANAAAVNWVQVPTDPGFGAVSALAYGGRQNGMDNPDVLYAGAGGIVYVRSTAGGTLTATSSPFPGASVQDIALDPEDWQHAFVVSSSGVWETTNAGMSWMNRTGNLVNANLQTVEFVDLPGADVVLVGGQGGVFRMLTNEVGVWTELGLNMPNAVTYELDYNVIDDVLAAGVFGAGAWTIFNASIVLPVAGTLNVCGDEQHVNQDDEFLLIRDAGNPAMLNVFLNGVLEFTGPLAALSQVNVFGIGGNDTLIVDSSNGLITLADGIRWDGDGACPDLNDEGGGNDGFGYDRGIDTLQLIQTGGDQQTTDTYSVGPDIGAGSSIIVGPGGTQTIFFEELEPVIDLVAAVTLNINATPEHNAITYSDATVATNGLVTIDNYESIEFSNKTNVVINAGSGDDVISADNALTPTALTTLTINGDDGRDTITLAQLTVATTVNGGAGNDVVDGSLVTAAVLTLNGGDGNDDLTGGAMGDVLLGNNGDDALTGGPGDNTYTGGAGFDTVIVLGTQAADLISVSQTAAATLVSAINGDVRTDTINTIEAVTLDAGSGADTIVATQADALVLAPAGSVPITVLGGPPGAGDSLRVFDDGLGDTDIHRLGPDGASGSFTIGPLAPISYEGVEYAALIPQNPITGGTGADGLGRLLVFKLDPFEQNNSLPSATHIGAGATLNVDPTIDPGGFTLAQQQIPGDEDWYRFVAAETGVLDFQVYFREAPALLNGRAGLPGNGALMVQVYDSDGLPAIGNPLGTGTPLMDPAGNVIGRHVAIPVVRNQVYNLRVFGTTAPSINVYNFSVINVPTPIPQQVDLTAATDSGRSDTDDITFFDANINGAAVFDIILDDDRLDEFNNLNLLPDTVNDDLPTVGFDYGVEVFNNGVSIGFAFLVSSNTWRFTATAGDLIEGHNNFVSAAVWVRDRATPAVLGRGDLSLPLQVTLDTIAPANPTIIIDPATSDTGVAAFPATIADRVTSDAATGFLGQAEADSIVRLWADGDPVSLGLINGSDVFQGLTVAEPLDGDEAFPFGQWDLTPRFDLNDPSVGFPLDGFRQITATAEDVAGNESSRLQPAVLNIFIDTQGPQVTAVFITDEPAFDLFDPKPTQGPTPLVNNLSITVRDLPNRSNIDPNFLYDALAHNPGHDNDPAEDPGNYLLRGDHNGVIPIQSVQFIPDLAVNGLPATGTIILTFFEPLPDDRFTLTLKDSLVDPAGNKLDGESNAVQPLEDPFFPSGDGQPGGDFVARFTVDTRPEIGVWAAGSVYIDTNGNFTFDTQNPDFVNRDITYALGFTSDDVFAGNFALNPADITDGFDKLGAYGRVNGLFRWLVDTDNDGVPNVNQVDPAGINGVPVAGRFDGNDLNGDEVGLFTGTTWWFDTNHDFSVDTALASNLRGYPIVGDFDGDGFDDLATWQDDVFQFDLANGVLNGWNGTVDATISFGFIGPRERPVAADMDQDGIDDIGLFVPDRGGSTPRETAEWYFLLSNYFPDEVPNGGGNGEGEEVAVAAAPAVAPIFGTVNTLDHPFTPIPFGKDIYAQFGDDYAVPVVGNFDPPYAGATSIDNLVSQTNPDVAEDVNADGYITGLDALLVINELNRVGSHEMPLQLASSVTAPYLDVNADGYVTGVDALWVINWLNAQSRAAAESPSGSVSSGAPRVASATVEDSTAARPAAVAMAARSVDTSAVHLTAASSGVAASIGNVSAVVETSDRRDALASAALVARDLLSTIRATTPLAASSGSGGQFEGLLGRRRARGEAWRIDAHQADRRMHALVDDRLARLVSRRTPSDNGDDSTLWDEPDDELALSTLACDVAQAARGKSAKDAAFADLL